MTTNPDPANDPRADLYAAERADLTAKVHKAMTSSYIGPPRPMLLGDADRAVAAVITAGWIPGTVTPHQLNDAEQAIAGADHHACSICALKQARAAARAFGLTVTELETI